jgi:hypothetical protein
LEIADFKEEVLRELLELTLIWIRFVCFVTLLLKRIRLPVSLRLCVFALRIRRSDGADGSDGSDFWPLTSDLSSLQQSINIRCLRIENANGAHLLQDAVQGLLGGAGAGLGFGLDLLEFGGDEVLSREDAAFAPRSNALDGGGDAFVPSHSRDLTKHYIKRQSRALLSFEFRVFSFELRRSRSSQARSRRKNLPAVRRGITRNKKQETRNPKLDTGMPVLFNPRRATSTDDWSSDEFFRHRFA